MAVSTRLPGQPVQETLSVQAWAYDVHTLNNL